MVTNWKRGLKNKKILITAGPTWIPIDDVRVITNVATGETGILLAEQLRVLGARVTLLLGQVGACCLNDKIRLVRFKFFKDLKTILIKELRSKRYDIVIHSAAVSDYHPKKKYDCKLNSDKKSWVLKLIPTPKIIDLIKKINHSLFLVGFKFEPNAKRSSLIKKAKLLIKRSNSDLVVTNTTNNNLYQAYIVDKDKIHSSISNKKKLVQKLIMAIGLKALNSI